MRIHPYRMRDMTTLIEIQQAAADVDGNQSSVEELEAWLEHPEMDVESNTFVVTDDDDELNPWGQAGTLEGVEGEIVGYTTLQLSQDEYGERAYHFLCRGAVLPQFRRKNVGRILLVGALNRARLLATEFEFEAEQEGIPIYFEALLPANDDASSQLAAKFEMLCLGAVKEGMQLYRVEL